MSKENLRIFQWMILGIISMFFSLPMIYPASSPSEYVSSIPYFDVIAFIGLPMVMVGLYYLLQFRSYLQKDALSKIQSGLIERLSESVSTKDPVSKKLDRLREDNSVMTIVHSITDSDESLKEKAKGMYSTEFIWRGLADLIGIGAIASVGYYIYSWINTKPIIILFGIVSTLICVAARYVFFPKVMKLYIEKSNEQFDQIMLWKKDELREALLKIF